MVSYWYQKPEGNVQSEHTIVVVVGLVFRKVITCVCFALFCITSLFLIVNACIYLVGNPYPECTLLYMNYGMYFECLSYNSLLTHLDIVST